MANHSDRSDPTTLFTLARLCNEDFYYLSARELFDHEFGLRGWFLQNVGAYSVIRGDPPDLESKEKTISLIVQGRKKLVMFPEGDVSGRDDLILPLKDDGIQNLFEAQGRLLENSGEPVLLLPVAAYYQATDQAVKHLIRCLSHLESILDLPSQSGSLSGRINRVADETVDHLGRHYGVESADKTSLAARLRQVCNSVTTAVARSFGMDVPAGQGEAVLLYSVRGKLRDAAEDPHASHCRYWRRLEKQTRKRKRAAISDLETMQQLLILASTLEQPFSPEAAWRLVDRLEFLLTGRLTPKGRRIVWLESGQPIDLRDYTSAYAKDAPGTREKIDHLVRSELTGLLRQLKDSSASTRAIA